MPDVVMGTESWLTADIGSSEVFPVGYQVFRRDRKPGIKTRGGGVFILVKDGFICSQINLESECEIIGVNLTLKGQKNVVLGCCYRPPWADIDHMNALVEAVTSIDPHDNGNVWLGGDFNLPHIDWENMCITTGNHHVKQSEVLINTVNDHSLTQVIESTTRQDSILDLFFTSNPTLVNRCGSIPPLAESDHDIVFVDLNTRAELPKKQPQPQHNFHKADWESMKNKLIDLKIPTGNVQRMWDYFEKSLQELVEKFVPTRRARPNNQKPWVTSDLKSLFNKRDRAFKRHKQVKNDHHKARYLQLRHEAQKQERLAYKHYTDSIFDLNSSNEPDNKSSALKRFWTFIKSKRKDSCGVSPLRKNGTLISDAKGKADVLNQQYSSVFTKSASNTVPLVEPSPYEDARDIVVNAEGVHKILKGLNPNKACGPDKIPLRSVKKPGRCAGQTAGMHFPGNPRPRTSSTTMEECARNTNLQEGRQTHGS